MKILFVIDSLGSGGAQNQLTLLATYLKKVGHGVTVFAYFELNFFEARLREGKVHIILEPKKNRLGWNIVSKLEKIIPDFDAMISFMDTPNFYSLFSKRRIKSTIPNIISYRTKTNFEEMPYSQLLLSKWVNKRTDYIVCNSYHEKKNWLNKFPKIAHKIHTIYNGVDIRKYEWEQKSRLVNKLIVVGQIRPLKNIKIIVEAMILLKKQNSLNFKVDFYGMLPKIAPVDEAYYKEVMNLVEEHELVNNIKFFPRTKEIHKYYTKYDALIHPSLLEGLPNVICEAMACGIPVLTGNILDHPILVKQAERGFLFNPLDAPDVAKIILNFYSLDISTYNKMQSNCRDYVREELSLNHISDSFLKLLKGKSGQI